MATTSLLKRIGDEFKIEHVGSSLLNELAKGLYTAESVLREYIQNAVDAHRLWEVEIGIKPEFPIQIEFRGNGISILDYGVGMDEEEARNVKSVAVSPKRNSSRDVELTGHKGVGIWAGLSFFESLTLRTSKKGVPKGFQITIHFKRILDAIDEKTDIGTALNPNYEIYEFPEDVDNHYTDITLDNPTQAVDWFLDSTKIKEAIRRICPCKINPNFVFHDEVSEWYEQHGFDLFDITLDGKRVYRDYSSAVDDFTTETFTISDIPVAEVWYAVTKKKMLSPNPGQLVGFRVNQSGFVIGDTNPYSARKMAGFDELSVGQYPNWFVGEIHVTSSELRPNLPRTDFEEAEIKRKFVQKVRKWYDERDVFCRVLSQKRQRLDTYHNYEKSIEDFKIKGAPLVLSEVEKLELIKVRDELYEDDKIAEQDKRGKAPKSVANIDGRREKEVRNKRKALLAEVEQLLSHLPKLEPPGQKASSKSKQPPSVGTDILAKPSGLPKSTPPLQPSNILSQMTDPSPFTKSLWIDNEQEENEVGQPKQVSLNVVLSLLEEVLREKIPDDIELQTEILQILQSRLSSVTLNG